MSQEKTKKASVFSSSSPRSHYAAVAIPLLLAGATGYGWSIDVMLNTSLLLTVATLVTTVVALQGIGRLSGLVGRIFVVGGVLGVIIYLLSDDMVLASYDMLARIVIVILGFYYERVSPERRLKRWMYLAIGTKIQAVLTATLFSVANDAIVAAQQWWLLVIGLMIVSVVFAARRIKRAYRLIVLTTSLLLLIVTCYGLLQEPDGLTVTLLMAVFLWPNVLQRIVGVKLFGSALQHDT